MNRFVKVKWFIIQKANAMIQRYRVQAAYQRITIPMEIIKNWLALLREEIVPQILWLIQSAFLLIALIFVVLIYMLSVYIKSSKRISKQLRDTIALQKRLKTDGYMKKICFLI